MIPVAPFSVPALVLLLLVPLLGGLLTLGLAGSALHFWWTHRGASVANFFTPVRWTLCSLALACDLWAAWLGYTLWSFQRDHAIAAHYQESRRRFVLPRDFQYGELRIPRGSLINRHDPSDDGAPQRPLGLRGLDAVRFAHPVQVGGVWATALSLTPTRLELARDQRLGPVVHFDRASGRWTPAPGPRFLDCKAGQVATFHEPAIDYDIQAEFLTGPPDGPAARLRPSEWRVIQCGSEDAPLPLQPAYEGSP